MSVFFALKPPLAIAERLVAAAQAVHDGRPTRADTVHLTLLFLGDFPAARVPDLIDVAGRIRIPAFDLVIDRLDYWGRQRLLWAGSSTPPPELLALAAALEASVTAAGLSGGVARNGYPFKPHITLARKLLSPAEPRPIAHLLWPCHEFVLLRSHHETGISVHERMHRFSLVAGAT